MKNITVHRPPSHTRENELEYCVYLAESNPFGELTGYHLYGSPWVNFSDLHRIYREAARNIRAAVKARKPSSFLSRREAQEWLWLYHDYLLDKSLSGFKPTAGKGCDPLKNTVASLFGESGLTPTGNAQGQRYK